MKWYRRLFLHFLDISATNAYILHKELMKQDSMTQKAFMEELIAQLCGVTQKTPVKKASVVHVPVSWHEHEGRRCVQVLRILQITSEKPL